MSVLTKFKLPKGEEETSAQSCSECHSSINQKKGLWFCKVKDCKESYCEEHRILENQPLFKHGVLYKPRQELGLGLLPWGAHPHVKALQVIKLLLNYCDATQGEF